MLLLFCGMAAAAEWDMGGMHKLAQQFELQATAEPPAWSIRSDRPLFRVAWLSDLHITDGASLKICRAALEQIGYRGFLTIEREVGENPFGDIAMAVEFLKKHIG